MDVDVGQSLRSHDPSDRNVGTGVSPGSGTVPFALRVGITGHRHFPPERLDALHNQIGIALDRVRALFPPTPDTGVVLTAVSALAEGADRLVVDAVLATAGSRLEVVLPLREQAYLADFETQSSKERFLELCNKASLMVTAPEVRPEDEDDPEKRSRQYEWASRYVVERCDVLLALWDGKGPRGTGGTAETLRYALEHRVPVLCIPTEGGELLEDLGSGEIDPGFRRSGIGDRHRATAGDTTPIDQTRRSFSGLDSYNRVPHLIFTGNNNPLGPSRFEQEVAAETMYLPADPPGIDLAELADWVRPYYVWADRRALMFERWYTIGIWVSFGAAALAVLAAALGAIFEIKAFLGVELALLVCIGAVVVFGRRLHLHDQWINSRFLAERLRSAVFLNAAGLGDRRDSGLQGLGPQNEYADWLRRAYEFVWDSRPDSDSPRLADLCDLLAEGWIQPQIDYHKRKSNTHESRESLLLKLSLALFALTFVLAIIHIISPTKSVSVLAISLPAFGSSIAGVSAHLQYHRHAVVYAGMARHLEFVKQRIKNAYTPTTLRAAASDADLIMASEQRDWIGVMRFLDLEVG